MYIKYFMGHLVISRLFWRIRNSGNGKYGINLYACSFISCLLYRIALSGVIGTYAPNAAGAVLPAINATAI